MERPSDNVGSNSKQTAGESLFGTEGTMYQALFERSADAILIIDNDTFVACNQATVEMLSYKNRADFLKTHPSELSPETQPNRRPSFEKANEMIALAYEKGSHRFEWQHLRSDGSAIPVEVLLTPIPQAGRKVLHVVWRDISEHKQLEAELRQAHKMEAIGKLTGGIAHDFNNLLVAIIGYAELLELELAEDSPFLNYVAQIKNAGDRAAGLVSQLLAFSRKQVLVARVIDLNELLTKMEKMLAPVLGEDILLECRLNDEPLAVLADSGQLEQVVINLVTNARDAMLQSGTLVLETSLVHLEPTSLEEGMRLSPGPHAVLAVTDTGTGISSQVLTNIFDPFFTTKEQGKGTGLGLSTVYGIVKQSGGDIVVESEPGQGSVFRVYLPIAPKAVEPQTGDELRPPASTRQASETVLLVEDEAAVSGLVERILRREGYQVHVASNGVEAMALVAAEGLRPDLLLTDVVMPEMGGPELARHLAPALPEMKILFASGYTDDALVHRGALADGVDLIQKPFAPRDLLKRLHNIFSAR